LKLRVLSPAIEEISTAALWFEGKRTGLGREFWRLTDELLDQVERNPLQFSRSEFATSEIDIRFAVIRRFNYVIHFAVAADEIQVASVAHGARRPGYWLTRIHR
jgi:hypothetical protein